jgi:hypothetical protein
MLLDVQMIVFNVVGQPSVAPSHRTMRRIESYVRQACVYGLTSEEIVEDIVARWPSPHRQLEIERLGQGSVVRVIFAPVWDG